MFCLVVAPIVALLVGEVEEPLPGALPPLDDALLQVDDGVTFFGHGRVRAAGEDDATGADPVVGAGLTARVGAAGSLEDVRGAVVVGDGGWFFSPPPPLEEEGALTSFDLVARPFLPFVHRLSVEVPLSPLGAPGQLVVGRQSLVVADGRLVGTEPFDARGRSVDGVVIDTTQAGVLFRAGAVALDVGATPDLRALGFIDATWDAVDRATSVDGYVLLHHVAPLLRPTLGARASADAFGVRWQAGADAQAALDEGQALSLRDFGVHAEATAKTLLPWHLQAPRPFLEMGVEGTGPFVAPAPTQHGTLGNLDLVAMQNTAQVWTRAGADDDDSGFFAHVTWRAVRSLGEVTDPRGFFFSDKEGALFTALDVDLGLRVAVGVDVDVSWAVALIDGTPAQRLWVGLRYSFGDDDELLPGL